MSARRLLTPKMADVLSRMRRANRPPLHTLDVGAARRAYGAAAEVLALPRAPLARVEALAIPAADGTPLPARLYAARAAGAKQPLPVVLYLHGGGFTIGNLETHDSLCRQLALHSGVAVVALDYRLAPEHRFPTAVDDAWAALCWLSRQRQAPAEAGSTGDSPRRQPGAATAERAQRARHQRPAAPLDPAAQSTAGGPGTGLADLDGTRLAVAGDSAGGTLAAVCAILARDAGLALRAQVLITPGTAAFADTPSHRTFASGFLLEADAIAWFFDHYIDATQRTDWRFAPLLVPELDGTAPALFVLAECDPLVDEGMAYADRLRMAGVAVELELARGVTHDFIQLGRVLPEAPAAQRLIADFLDKALQ